MLTMGSLGSTTVFEGGSNVTINKIYTTTAQSDLTYLAVNRASAATSFTSNQAQFPGAFLQPAAESLLSATTKNSFIFYVNGIYIRPDYIISFVDNGNGTCTLTLDTSSAEFQFESTDEILAVGKFAE
jgi:hypothetical protein